LWTLTAISIFQEGFSDIFRLILLDIILTVALLAVLKLLSKALKDERKKKKARNPQ
jgi:hypothetical protein